MTSVRRLSLLGAIVVVAAVAVSAGFGSPGASDPAGQIRANLHAMVAALEHDKLAKFCSYSTDSGECMAAMRLAEAVLGSGKIGDYISDQQVERAEKAIDTAPVHVSRDGKRATIGTGRDADKWVKKGGAWKEVRDWKVALPGLSPS
jgi:hypothetical protein